MKPSVVSHTIFWGSSQSNPKPYLGFLSHYSYTLWIKCCFILSRHVWEPHSCYLWGRKWQGKWFDVAAQFNTLRTGSRITGTAFSRSHHPADARTSRTMVWGKEGSRKDGRMQVLNADGLTGTEETQTMIYTVTISESWDLSYLSPKYTIYGLKTELNVIFLGSTQ